MFCGGRGKIGGLVEKSKGPWVGTDVMIFFMKCFLGVEKTKTREDKRRQKYCQTRFFFKTVISGHMLKNN